MLVVTVRGNNRHFATLLQKSTGADMLYVETRDAAFYGKSPTLILATGQTFSRIACENAAFIVRGNGCLPTQIDCKNAIAIVDSSDTAVLEQVAARHLRALTCGLGRSDTFTFSSLTTDSAVISLQRRITTCNGSLVEPFEVPICFSTPIEPFWLLACAAVACLVDENDFSKQTVEYGFVRKI